MIKQQWKFYWHYLLLQWQNINGIQLPDSWDSIYLSDFFFPPWHIVNSTLAACFTWETGSWQTEASKNTSCFSHFQGSPSAGKHPYQHAFKERAGLGPYKNWSTHLSLTTEKFHRKSQNKSWAIFERFGLKSRQDRQHLKCKVCNNWNLRTISQKKGNFFYRYQ